MATPLMVSMDFNPRSPYGERRQTSDTSFQYPSFQSTLPLRGATPRVVLYTRHFKISIHAPLTGSDACLLIDCEIQVRFQSTLPLRGATLTHNQLLLDYPDFNPRSPYGERPSGRTQSPALPDFNPRSPYGERRPALTVRYSYGDFNPRSPYGERPLSKNGKRIPHRFQSTLPLRGATADRPALLLRRPISIHAPLTGSDFRFAVALVFGSNFNPRSPYGERLVGVDVLLGAAAISIHAPLTGSDLAMVPSTDAMGYFNPRSPYGERLNSAAMAAAPSTFQSTLPLRGATRRTRGS